MLWCEAMKIMQYMTLEMSAFTLPINDLPFVISVLDITQARPYLK